ncbi:MAG TPA: Stp1/IreP family PP2C-type Ser/Thr phosphatase [Gaiellales bacterium]|jgi:PPM family protein phosphatase|nr:Stp1/IreP family PP2C-type Ser/Thr phosphatase [Gaiellales bacterium]
MTVGVVDSAGLTQTGNVRRSNEDSFLLRSPLFMVADGMGGALAGELASRMCAEAFAELDLIEHQGEEALRETIGIANRRIWDRSRTDAETSGMGTTVTAALVGDGGVVSFAHVGDSRAYLLRDGALQRLSEDHSLVHELVRQGQLSEVEAEQHPQRSVITRALGTDEEVQIDTFSLQSKPGDVLLLCTDGLNTMVSEADIAAALGSETGAADVARRLVRAALKAGGEDNVTAVVVCFGETSLAVEEDDVTSDGAVHRVLPADIDAPSPRRPRDPRQRSGGGALRRAAMIGSAVVLVAVLAVAGAIGLRASHFIGADTSTGRVAIYQGVPVDLPFGVHLYHVVYESRVSYVALPPDQRKKLFDHTLRSESSAHSVLRPYEVASP